LRNLAGFDALSGTVCGLAKRRIGETKVADLDDVDTAARTIWGEARGEGNKGMEAVACVIANRVAIARHHVHAHKKPHPLFGDGTFAGCCRCEGQFSCWNAGDPNLSKLQNVDASDSQFDAACKIAQRAVDGKLKDITNGATHYYERHIAPPAWAKGKTPCATIGNHLFFSL
jgi:N-acetylmuramoyl-L-alanine amidase